MGQSTTTRLWDTGQEDCPSQYTRMIPGTSAMPTPRFAPKNVKNSAGLISAIDDGRARRTSGRLAVQQILRQPARDRFMLFEIAGSGLDCSRRCWRYGRILIPRWGAVGLPANLHRPGNTLRIFRRNLQASGRSVASGDCASSGAIHAVCEHSSIHCRIALFRNFHNIH
jgi:hypothetical protein